MYKATLSASSTEKVGALSKLVNRFVFQTVGSSWTGSIVPKVVSQGSGLTGGNIKGIHYTNKLTGADVVAGTGITTDGIWEVQTDGVDLYLDYTHTSGSVLIVGNAAAG